MKKNNLIQEELVRAKQIWGWETSKTIFEQTTGCLAVSQRTMCTGATHTGGWVGSNCATIDGQPLTQNDVGTVVRISNQISTDNLQFTIDQVQSLNQTQPSMDFISDVCPTTPPPGGGGGPMKPTISFCSGGTFTTHYPITLNGSDLTQADVNKTIMGNYNNPNNPLPFHGTITSISPSSVGGGVDTSEVPCGLPPGGGPGTTPFYCLGGVAGMSCVQTSTPPMTPAGGPFNTMADCQNSGCGGTTPPTPTCNKTCQQLAPKFKTKVNGKGCNWLNNRLTALNAKLATKQDGTCAHKRISCKIGVIKASLTQQGC